MTPPPTRAFAGPAAFRAWLRKHHATEDELLVRCCKTAAKDRGLTYHEALDEALCCPRLSRPSSSSACAKPRA